jgi:integrase
MLTLQRREEVVSMQWRELDNPADPRVWTLPGERAKNGKSHIVHLAEPVRALLRTLPRVDRNPFVFAGQSQAGRLGAFSATKTTIGEAIEMTDGLRIDDWRFHDFRRTGVTMLAGMGFPPHVCDRLLNHLTGTIQGVAAVYQRAEFLAERKAALEAWAAHVVAAGERHQPMGNVIHLAHCA